MRQNSGHYNIHFMSVHTHTLRSDVCPLALSHHLQMSSARLLATPAFLSPTFTIAGVTSSRGISCEEKTCNFTRLCQSVYPGSFLQLPAASLGPPRLGMLERRGGVFSWGSRPHLSWPQWSPLRGKREFKRGPRKKSARSHVGLC